jgi:hypothetical protein
LAETEIEEMPMNLTPEQLRAVQQMMQGGAAGVAPRPPAPPMAPQPGQPGINDMGQGQGYGGAGGNQGVVTDGDRARMGGDGPMLPIDPYALGDGGGGMAQREPPNSPVMSGLQDAAGMMGGMSSPRDALIQAILKRQQQGLPQAGPY